MDKNHRNDVDGGRDSNGSSLQGGDSQVSSFVSISSAGTSVDSTAVESDDGSGLQSSFASVSSDDTEAERRIPSRSLDIPGYEILSVLGSGGMGVVYRARQTKLNRIVALKLIRTPAEDVSARFRTEAETAARLQHPNIVQIYECGKSAAGPYFALEYVDGGSLAHKIGGTPLPPREAAELLLPLARAMHYAHSHGIVHRDLKPSNVLLQEDEKDEEEEAEEAHLSTSLGSWRPGVKFVPKIADFGLAKSLDTDSGQTKSGAVLGTPSYMAPEQASGRSREAGPAADVYALGAILYEMLTGRAPFKAATVMETLAQVVKDEPVLPTRLTKVPRNLETICLKCLKKKPVDRYATAAALADDLHRFLAGEPIRARRAALPERAYRWVLRHWVLTSVALFVAATLLIVTGWTLYMNAQLRSANAEKDLHAIEAETEASKAQAAKELAEKEAANASEAKGLAEKEAANARKAQNLADTRLDDNKAEQHKHNIGVAWTFLQQRLHDAADAALSQVPDSHRGWEWQHLRYLVQQAPQPVATLAVHDWGIVAALAGPDAQPLISSGQDGRVIVWDTEQIRPLHVLYEGIEAAGRGTWLHALSRTDKQPEIAAQLDCFVSLCWLREGKVCVGASLRGRLMAWDLTADRPSPRELLPRDSALSFQAIAASADGNRVLAGAADGTLVLHQIRPAKTVKRSLTGGAVTAVGALPSGHWIVGQEAGNVVFLDTEAQVVDRATVPAPVWGLATSASGGRVAVACGTPRLLTFEADAGANRLHRGESYLLPEVGKEAPKALHAVRIAADGSIAAGDDAGRLVVWRQNDHRPQWVVPDQKQRPFKAEEIAGLPLPLRRRLSVLIWPGASGMLLSGGPNTLIRRWDVPESAGTLSFTVGPEPVARFDPLAGEHVWVGTRDGDLQLWESRKGTKRLEIRAAHRGPITGLDVAADGTLATGGADGVLRFWKRAGTGADERLTEIRSLLCPDRQAIRSVSLSTDGQRVAVYTGDDWAHVWDVAHRDPISSVDLRRRDKALRGLAVLSPSGSELAVTGPGQTFQRRSGARFQEVIDLSGDHAAGSGGTAIVWNPAEPNDIVSGDTDGRLRWHPTRRPSHWINPRMTGNKKVAGLAFTPDGSRLAAVAEDGSLELIELQSGTIILSLPAPPKRKATGVLFDRKGERLAVIHEDGQVVIRETLLQRAAPYVEAARDWEEQLVLPRPGYSTRDLWLHEPCFDRSGALWFFCSRPGERTAEIDRLRLRALFLARLSGPNYEEESYGMCDGALVCHALLARVDEVLAVVRRKTGPITGQSFLYRHQINRPLTAKAEGEGEPFLRDANNGFCLALLSDPTSKKPAALHFSHAGFDLYHTSWSEGIEQTGRVGRHGDGMGLEAVGAANRLHLLFGQYRFDHDPHPPVLVTSADGAKYRELDRAILDAAPIYNKNLAADPKGHAIVLYRRFLFGEGYQWVLACREQDGWRRAIVPEAKFGVSILPSNLVCDRNGTIRFAYLDKEYRRLCLATRSDDDWKVEQVWENRNLNELVANSKMSHSLALRLDSNDHPVIVASSLGSEIGWVRVFRWKQ